MEHAGRFKWAPTVMVFAAQTGAKRANDSASGNYVKGHIDK